MEEKAAAFLDLESIADDEALTEREREFQRLYRQRQRRARIATTVTALLLAAAFVISFVVGRYSLSPGQVLRSLGGGLRHAWWSVRSAFGAAGEETGWLSGSEDTAVWLVRMPRILAAMLVGGALAASGATYQGLFRNPMVSPDILGASAGASVGACLMMLLNQGSVMIQVGAFVMGIGAVALSYFLSKALGRLP